MTSKIHLPLNTIDSINQPPLFYLQIQDTLILSTGLFWTITYILYIRQAYRDESYGMPIIALCANIGWEIVYGFRLPFTLTQILVFVPWLIIDAFLVYTTMKFGPNQWNHAPMRCWNDGGSALGICGDSRRRYGCNVLVGVCSSDVSWNFLGCAVDGERSYKWSFY